MKNKNSLMYKILHNPKVMLFFSIILAFVADFASVFVIYKAEFELQYLIFPLVILILDIIFFVSSIFSNYRFKYSFMQMISYLILVTVGVAGVALLFALDGKAVVMTYLSVIMWVGVHILGFLSVITNSVYAGKVHKTQRKFSTILTSVIFTAMTIFFTATVCENGFFGQGYIEEEKTLVYEYDQTEKGYVVQKALKGRGNTAVILDEFNGKPVVAVNCDLFVDDSLRAVRFEKGTNDVKFRNVVALEKLTSDKEMTLYAEKEDIDIIKNNLLETSFDKIEKEALLQLANTFYPTKLSENEVYVSFYYSDESYDIANGVVFHTWFGEKGETFDVTFDSETPYSQYYDRTNNSHLDWNYEHNDKYILKTLLDSNGHSIYGERINKSIKNVEVSFEKIYAVSIEDDNDTKYEVSDEYRYTILDDKVVNYRYVLEDTADTLINEYPLRDGFSLKWYNESSTFTDLNSLLTSNEEVIRITPEWTLENPEILSLNTNVDNNTFTYGDDITLISEVSNITNGIEFKYEWTCEDALYTGNNYVVSNVHPNQSGTYELKVTAYSNTITSLTSSSTKTMNISIEKKLLNFDWTLPSDLVYNGDNKKISSYYDDTQVINNDDITFELSGNTIHDAGSYTYTVSLTGDANEKYRIPVADSQINFEISKREVSVNWQVNKKFTYDGLEHSIAVDSINNYVNNEEQEIISSLVYTGNQINAGTHKMSVTLNHKNYVLDKVSVQENFIINKRNITITFEDCTKMYDGKAKATNTYEYNVDNLASTDKIDEVVTFIFNGNAVTAKDVNTYDLIVEAGDATKFNNYNITIYGCHLTITKADITLTWQSDKELDYNGLSQGISINTVGGNVASGESSLILKSLVYSGSKTNVGTYTMTVRLPDTTNYYISTTQDTDGDGIVEATYNINKINLTVTIDNKQTTYNGFKYSSFTYKTSGLASTDAISDVITFSYSGEATTAVNVGTYNISISYTEATKGGNYNINVVDGKLTINAREVTLIWSSATTFTYDGIEHNVSVVDINNEVTSEHSLLMSQLVYSGAQINAGSHVMSVTLNNSNYKIIGGSDTCSYKINQRDLVITSLNKSKTYDGLVYSDFGYSHDGLASTDTIEEVCSITYDTNVTNAKNQGIYTIRFTVNRLEKYNNYNISTIYGTLTINRKEITLTWGETTFTYNGQKQGAEISSIAGGVSGENILSTITYNTSEVNAGNYTRVASLPEDSNYVIKGGTELCSYRIEKRDLVITYDDQVKTYDGKSYSSYSYSQVGLASTDTMDEVLYMFYEGEGVSKINVGSYTFNVQHEQRAKYNNYNITINVNGNIIINQRDITLVWQSTKSFTYNGEEQAPKVVSITNAVSDEHDVLVLNLVYNAANINYGSYTRTASLDNDNYNIINSSSSCSYNITKRSLVINVDSQEKTYNGQAFTNFTYSQVGLASKDTMNEVISYTYIGTAIGAINAGTYTINMEYTASTKANNYNIVINGSQLKINPKAITLVWDNVTSFEYDGNEHNIRVKDIIGAVEDESSTLLSSFTYNESQVNAGSYTMTVSFTNGNYVVTDGSSSCRFTITQKALLISTANKEKTYDGSVYDVNNFSYEPIGLASTDTFEEVGTVVYKNTVLTAKNAGTYDIAFTITAGEKYNNYAIETVFGKLTINKKAITLTWESDTTFAYNGNAQGPKVSYVSGAVNDEDVLSTIIYNDAEVNAGTYTRIAYLPENSNYVITGGNECSYKIETVDLVITINNQEKTYDGSKFTNFTVTSNGLKANDTLSEVVTLTYTGNAVNAIDAGTYTISATYVENAKAKNYNITIVNGTLTINPKTVNLVWESDTTYEYDGTKKGPEVVSVSGVSSAESKEIIDSLTYTGYSSSKGTHTATATTSNGNYVLSNNTCEYTIVDSTSNK